MFSSFRQRLLFWFLVVISFNGLLIYFTNLFVIEREKILRTTEMIKSIDILLLKDFKTQQDFFSYETTNSAFFHNKQSRYLTEHQMLLDSMLHMLNALNKEADEGLFELKEIPKLSMKIMKADSIFRRLSQLILERGYKDFSVEGQMRTHAHYLESFRELDQIGVLNLRRHEKDYIIRNELTYVMQLNSLAKEMERNVRSGKNSPAKKDSILFHLEQYVSFFNGMVTLDKQMGIRDNTGVKQALDNVIHDLENELNSMVVTSQKTKTELLASLNTKFRITAIMLILIGLAVSYVIARKVTRPLTDLTSYIARFVDSNFTFEDGSPPIRSKDEVGKLTQNFTILKEEVITRLRFFKQKVDERTAELADVNRRLIQINVSNARFVPKEFLEILGKKSVEEVSLGDQVDRDMTVMFIDIRSFTRRSEKLSPQDSFDFLNRYLGEIVPTIKNHNGIIDKFLGDGVMALFPDDVDHAFDAALACVAVIDQFNAVIDKTKTEPIRIGIGIHSGKLILGTIGHADRLETTVISDAVNTASRLEGLAKHYGAQIITSEDCIAQLRNVERFHYRCLDTVRVKGKHQALTVYEFIGNHEKEKIAGISDFNEGIELMKQRSWQAAAQVFSLLLARNTQDEPVRFMLNRANGYALNGVPTDWDGMEVMESK